MSRISYIRSDELYDHCNHDQEYWINKHYKGWEKIIRPCIDRAIEKGHRIQQIKAKIGSLRFYWTPCEKGGILGTKDPIMDQLVNDAVKRSFRTCTQCGVEDDSVLKTRGHCQLCVDGWFDRMVKEEL